MANEAGRTAGSGPSASPWCRHLIWHEIERGDEPDIGSGVAVACRKALVAPFVQCGRPVGTYQRPIQIGTFDAGVSLETCLYHQY